MASILNRGPHQWQVTLRRKEYTRLLLKLQPDETEYIFYD